MCRWSRVIWNLINTVAPERTREIRRAAAGVAGATAFDFRAALVFFVAG
jgi:hypothetical protein